MKVSFNYTCLYLLVLKQLQNLWDFILVLLFWVIIWIQCFGYYVIELSVLQELLELRNQGAVVFCMKLFQVVLFLCDMLYLVLINFILAWISMKVCPSSSFLQCLIRNVASITIDLAMLHIYPSDNIVNHNE